jgi:hypothetical protein
MDDKVSPRWQDDTCVIVARYSGWCGYCGGRITREKSKIQRRHGEWFHQRCAEQLVRECCRTVAV